MCCISASFDKSDIIKLIRLGAYRGGHSYSITLIDQNYEAVFLERSLGNVEELINKVDALHTNDNYIVVHQQAPTTQERTLTSVHPSEYNNSLLWHNGIIKQPYIDSYNTQNNTNIIWDTQIVHRQVTNSFSNLSDILGAFACVFKNKNKLFLFRNAIVPLFIDDNLNISSVKFNNSKLMEHNKVFFVDLIDKTVDHEHSFFSIENPYNI